MFFVFIFRSYKQSAKVLIISIGFGNIKMITFAAGILTLAIMGKLVYFLCFIFSVFPSDTNENRRHIHIVKRGNKHSHTSNTVAKIWIEKNGEKNIEIAWSELSAKEEIQILQIIDNNWEKINLLIDKVFAGEKIKIMEIK